MKHGWGGSEWLRGPVAFLTRLRIPARFRTEIRSGDAFPVGFRFKTCSGAALPTGFHSEIGHIVALPSRFRFEIRKGERLPTRCRSKIFCGDTPRGGFRFENRSGEAFPVGFRFENGQRFDGSQHFKFLPIKHLRDTRVGLCNPRTATPPRPAKFHEGTRMKRDTTMSSHCSFPLRTRFVPPNSPRPAHPIGL
jgi:hypothetical protein